LALLGLFGRGRKPRDAEAVAAIKASVLRLLALPPRSSVTVSEILCPDPGCPDLETVILVMRPGQKTQAFKIRLPIPAVTEQDLEEALVSVDDAGQR
jgi:hypothetical protein